MRPRCPRPLLGWIATWLALASGCGTGDGTAGMSGRQVVRGHDVADLFFADANTVAFTRQTADPSQSEPQDLWLYGLGDDAPSIALSGIDWAPPVWWANVRIGSLLETGPSGRLFYDFSSRQRTDLSDFASAPAGGFFPADAGAGPGAAAYQTLAAIRRDGAAVVLTGATSGSIGVGPPAAVARYDLPGAPLAMNFMGSDVAVLFEPADADPPAIGLYRLATDTGALTPLVPPQAPTSAWSPSIAGCIGFGTDPCAGFKIVGCAGSDPGCPDTGITPCAIVYVKQDPDNPGSTLTYAYDVNAGSALQLPGQGAAHLFVSPDQHLLVWDDSQIISKRYWDLCSGKKDFCPQMAGPHLLWRADSKGFATVTDDGSLAVADFANNLCTGQPVATTAYAAFYSPVTQRLAWLATDDANGSPAGLWVAQNDGSDAVLIDAGTFSGARFSPDESKMLVSRSASSSVSLAWLDMTVSPPAEHALVDNYGGFSRMGNQRVLLVDDWNTQDAAGDLTLLDMTTGKHTVLGRAVTSFGVSGGGVDAAGTNVAYVARSRVASDRDGLWLTTLPP
jgi:hypothetical protein